MIRARLGTAGVPRPSAYPRRCGEHRAGGWTRPPGQGLPPQVRGARVTVRRRGLRNGLTPAGAGSTGHRQTPRSAQRAYPRRCGEHNQSDRLNKLDGGLPPQVRGAPHLDGSDRSPGGLTPAGAGSTGRGARRKARGGAYPRRCGEHLDVDDDAVVNQGLPPQVRGALDRVVGLEQLDPGLPPQVRGAPEFVRYQFTPFGLTPAGAGSTQRHRGL